MQARPETVQSQHKTLTTLEIYDLQRARPSARHAAAASARRSAAGPVRVITDVPHDLHDFQAGEVLVTDKTDPDWEPIMKKAAAIVTNRGGRTCHAAIVSRELGLPAIVGTEHGTERAAGRPGGHRLLRRGRHRLRLRGRSSTSRSSALDPRATCRGPGPRS